MRLISAALAASVSGSGVLRLLAIGLGVRADPLDPADPLRPGE
jgi:hypothetical protein